MRNHRYVNAIFAPCFANTSAIGIILGPFIGALIGAKMEGPDVKKALKIALGALAGFMVGTVLKLSVSLYIIYLIYLSTPPLW